MKAILIVLNVIMALLLWWKRGCKWFAFIQTIQLLEIYPMMHGSIACWMSLDQANIVIEGIAIISTVKLCTPRVLMLIHAYAKLYRYSGVDCTYQLTRDSLYHFIYYLDILILFVLLAYAGKQPLLRLKEFYVTSAQTRRRAH